MSVPCRRTTAKQSASSTARTTTYTQYGRSTIEWGGDVRAAFELVGDESLQAEIRREGTQRRVFFLGGEDLDADSAAQRVQLDAAEKSDLSQERLYPQEYLVGCRAARPLVGDRHRTFQVAFRAGDPGRFTPRPREVWVEIVPAELDKDGKPAAMASAEPYFIAQPAYAAGSSYPVAELNAPNWPAGAEAALVKVWFRMTDSREVTKLDESGLRRPNASGFAGGGFAYGLEYLEPRKQWAIRVVESQSRSPGQQPAWSLVTLEGTPADEVERRFFTDAGRVEHFFIFRDLQKSDLAKRAVNIVPQQIWKESATAVPKEFTVVIPRN